jgi:signal transduction histidine kinase
MDAQLTQSQFSVETHIEPSLPRVLADEGAAEQAIENLLANAIKYSGESKTLSIDVRRSTTHVTVSVTDHGIGIPRREQGRIFRKFYRVQRDLGGGQQGCGLGLASSAWRASPGTAAPSRCTSPSRRRLRPKC